MHELFFQIGERYGTTIIVVTHNVKLAQSMPRIVELRDGRIHADERRGANGYGAASAPPPATAAEAPADAPPAT